MPRSPTMVRRPLPKSWTSPCRLAISGGLRGRAGRHIRQAEGDIAADGFAEEVGVLRTKPMAGAGGERPFADGAAVNQNAVIGRFPERAMRAARVVLPLPVGPTIGEESSRRDFEMNVAKDGMRTAAMDLERRSIRLRREWSGK